MGEAAHVAARPAYVLCSEYAFLLNRCIDAATLAQAEALGQAWGVRVHEVLIAQGWLSAEDYCRALAAWCGTPCNSDLPPDATAAPGGSGPRRCLAEGLLKERRRAQAYVLAADRLRPNAMRDVVARLWPYTLILATPQSVRAAIFRQFAGCFARDAVEGLRSRFPGMSAKEPSARWQSLAVSIGATALLLGAAVAPRETVWTITSSLAVLFVAIIAFRLLAVYRLLREDAESAQPQERIADRDLPIYTVLVPLYGEAHMLPSLVTALRKLDYPSAKLDVKLILEAVDRESIAVAKELRLPGNFEIVVVPDLPPRTKPKALNFALPLARGEYMVIYDAEDRPEPNQLRQALAAFRAGPPNLAAVQARLSLYNADENWLTGQFTIEYCALFDGLLPMLDRLDLPIPLGGTSNHFRASALRWLMAWDAFNVTEDADLGIRLARYGYRCRMLPSTTYEEAPARPMAWLKQRTRWLKGYVQTWLVHMRAPKKLWTELGPRGFLAFQIMVGGTILSGLVHPWFYVLASLELGTGAMLAAPESLFGWPFWVIAWFNLSLGYLASMALGFLAVRKRGYRALFWQVVLMPLYWLLISAAAYRALWQFVTARFRWEKTAHGAAARRPSRRRQRIVKA